MTQRELLLLSPGNSAPRGLGKEWGRASKGPLPSTYEVQSS